MCLALSRHVGRQHCGGERWPCGVTSPILKIHCELVQSHHIRYLLLKARFFLGKAPFFGQPRMATWSYQVVLIAS